MQTVIDIAIFIVVLLVLISFHEFGHLIAAKLSKIPVEKFSIGFGPAIVKWNIGETVYQISIVPLGGFVKFKGEEFDDPEGFFAFPFGRKAITTGAGIIANMILAIVIYFVIGIGWGVESPTSKLELDQESSFAKAGFLSGDSVLAVNGKEVKGFEEFARQLSKTDTISVTVMRGNERLTLALPPSDSFDVSPYLEPIVGRVISKTPAAKAGLKRGDRVIDINGKKINSWSSLHYAIQTADSTKSLKFSWVHDKDTLTAAITPEPIKLTGSKGIGVLVYVPSRPLTFAEALWLPIRRTGEITAQIFTLLAGLVSGKESARNLGGVILIATLSAQSRKWGLDHLLGLLAYLSISLAIINLFPIPALDGGRILMFAIEKVSRRRFGKKVWTVAVNIGFVAVLLLVGLTLFNDIFRLVKGG